MKGMTMNRAEKYTVAVNLGVITYFVVVRISSRIRYRRRIEKIKAHAKAQIEAMQAATEILEEKIQRGEYDRPSFQQLASDFDFYTIVNLDE
jgi:hypothetical protein